MLNGINKTSKIKEEILNCTGLLFEVKNDFPSPVGSCVFIKANDDYFFISASHLFDGRQNLFLILHDKEMQVGGVLKRTSLPQSGNRLHDKLDFSFQKISKEQAYEIENRFQFINANEIGINEPLNNVDDYLVIGYPAKEPKRKAIKEKDIKTKVFTFWTRQAKTELYSKLEIMNNQNILFYFDQKNVKNESTGLLQKAPDIEGISGCGVWVVEKENGRKRLIGIVTESKQDPGAKVLIVTRIDVMTETLNKEEGTNFTKSRLIRVKSKK